MSFRNRVVWITGASSGIGEALAFQLSARGAKLILSSRRLEALQKVKEACPGRQGNIRLLPLDLARGDELPAKAKEALALFDRVDVLINNAGVSQRSLVCETQLAVDRLIMEINFFGAVALTKAVLPSMLARGSGHIVVVSSVMGKFASPYRSAYAASKHALHGFFDALRAEVEGRGVQVTIACPGFVRTSVSLNALTGDGSPHAKLDPGVAKGISPEVCARHILRAVEQGKEEVVIGKEKVAVYLKRFFPGLLSRAIRRVRVT